MPPSRDDGAPVLTLLTTCDGSGIGSSDIWLRRETELTELLAAVAIAVWSAGCAEVVAINPARAAIEVTNVFMK